MVHPETGFNRLLFSVMMVFFVSQKLWLSIAVGNIPLPKRLLSAFSPVRRLAGILKRQTVVFQEDLQFLSEQQVFSYHLRRMV